MDSAGHHRRKSTLSNSSRRSSLGSLFGKSKHEKYKYFTADIKDYELHKDIGKHFSNYSFLGGVDDVSYLYLAKHTKSQEWVSLKYTDLSLSPDYEFIQELIKTSHNTLLCKHPHILPYFTTFTENERLWTVTLPIQCGSCRHILKNHFPQGFGEVVVASILKQVLLAILYLHANHSIHNDIRADNILMDAHGHVRLTGFRQCMSLAESGQVKSSVFSLVGDNIEWAAPEVIAQNTNYDEKADMYSFGITALELAFNQTPFDHWPPFKILLSKLNYDCPKIDTQGKIMSGAFYNMVLACLRKDPTKRPAAHELLEYPFFKSAKSDHYLESNVAKKANILKKTKPSSPQ